MPDEINLLAIELVDRLAAIDDGDLEKAHVEADRAVCDLLRQVGFDNVADAWSAVCRGFWYA